MALRPVISEADLAKLPDAIKAEYVKGSDGNFVLSVTPENGFALENVSALRKALETERGSKSEFEKKLGAFGDLDPSKAREALKKLAEWGDVDPGERAKKIAEDRIKEIEAKLRGEVEAEKKNASQILSQLEGALIDSTATAALAKAKGNARVLLPHVKQSVRMVKDANGNYVAKVVNSDGSPRITLKSGQTGDMTIEELVEGMRADNDYASCFEGSGATGGGTKPNGSGSGSGSYRISAADARDHSKYQQAKAQADKAGVTLEVV